MSKIINNYITSHSHPSRLTVLTASLALKIKKLDERLKSTSIEARELKQIRRAIQNGQVKELSKGRYEKV